MNAKEVIAKLKSLANEKVYERNVKNGAGKNQFGVQLGDIRAIATKIKKDHDLALELWKTDNIDARLLATMIIEPKKLSAKQLDDIVKSIEIPQEADWVNSYVVKEFPDKEKFREKWMDSKNVWAARAGWSLTAGRVLREPAGLDLDELLNRIEKQAPKSAREVQWTMNTTLAYIGIEFPKHRKRALELGEKLELFKDYPVSKGCTSPFAPIWINEMVKRKTK